eukprot:3938871-Rhodomonas_salina.3
MSTREGHSATWRHSKSGRTSTGARHTAESAGMVGSSTSAIGQAANGESAHGVQPGILGKATVPVLTHATATPMTRQRDGTVRNVCKRPRARVLFCAGRFRSNNAGTSSSAHLGLGQKVGHCGSSLTATQKASASAN